MLSEKHKQRHEKSIEGVRPELALVVDRAMSLCEIDFLCIEGLRTMKRQRELVARGASQTLKSRHLTGHAVDLVPVIDDQIRWDWPLFDMIAAAMKAAANELDVTIEWGGDWRRFRDGPHFQLSAKRYPA